METEAEFVIFLNLRSQFGELIRSKQAEFAAQSRRRKGTVYTKLKMCTFPQGCQLLCWSAHDYNELLKAEKNYSKQWKRTGLCSFLLMPFGINVDFCPVHAYKWNYWLSVHVLITGMVLVYDPTNDSIFMHPLYYLCHLHLLFSSL